MLGSGNWSTEQVLCTLKLLHAGFVLESAKGAFKTPVPSPQPRPVKPESLAGGGREEHSKSLGIVFLKPLSQLTESRTGWEPGWAGQATATVQ